MDKILLAIVDINLFHLGKCVPTITFIPESEPTSVAKLPLEKRLLTTDPDSLASRLFRTMLEKESNLCVAADLTTMPEILDLVEKIGDKICCLKLHFDIVITFASSSLNLLC